MQEKTPIVLCVDDSPEFLQMVEVMLTRHGFRVLTATSGQEGIALFRKFPCTIAILDYIMPGMKGGELAQKLRALDPKLPIILHTGYGEIDDPLLANVDCTIPKGSFSFLMNTLNKLAMTKAREVRSLRKRPRSKRSAA